MWSDDGHRNDHSTILEKMILLINVDVFLFLRPYACQPGDNYFCDSETLSVVSRGELLFSSWPIPRHFALFVSCFSQVFLCSLIYCPFALSIQHIGIYRAGWRYFAAKAKNLMFQVEQATLVQACQIDVHLLRTSDAVFKYFVFVLTHQ